jgi:ubiquinone/menaquinone biosynthesis C-methylase UbiE
MGVSRIGATSLLPPVDEGADRRFRELLREAGIAPDDRFSGGYVAWEWDHSRHLFEELPLVLGGSRVLEVGCNLGATAVVLALLGAEVTAVDVSARYLPLARANAERFGVASRIRFARIDAQRLPVLGGVCDLVTCNSVLEYVAPSVLPHVQREIDRVLRPGGLVAVMGTSSRLWPREVHSGQWLTNYVPRWLDAIGRRVGRRFGWSPRPRRGLTPWRIRAGFPGYPDLLAGEPWLLLRSKARMGTPAARIVLLSLMTRLLAPLRLSPGALLPSITMLLEKPHAGRSSPIFA